MLPLRPHANAQIDLPGSDFYNEEELKLDDLVNQLLEIKAKYLNDPGLYVEVRHTQTYYPGDPFSTYLVVGIK